jgi:dTDP-4-dehydrorhamnose 3,5-epimerase-like enzyme
MIGVVDLNLNGDIRVVHKPKVFYLSDSKPQILIIPGGCANGIKTLTKDCIIQVYSTATLEESYSDDMRFPVDEWDIWKIEER